MRKIAGSNILLVVAHPDDEVLGCGGTIFENTKAGNRVWCLVLGEGITSRADLTVIQKKKLLNLLKNSAKNANRLLNVEKVILRNFPDNQFDSVPLLKIIHSIENIVEKFCPNVIFTHSLSDVNVDHRIVIKAVEAVVRPGIRQYIEKVFSFEAPSSTDWNFIKKPFRPNVFVSLEKNSLDKKIGALKKYEGEIRKFPHPRSETYLRALATVRGGQSGYKLAEAFELIYSRML